MLNLYPIIKKLEKIQSETDHNGARVSLAGMLRELADFREHDLNNLIQLLYEQQRLADEMKVDLEQEIDLLQQRLTNREEEIFYDQTDQPWQDDIAQL